MKSLRKRQKRAVSEVVGALLLILVVVIAVGSFAAFLSYTQSTAQNRQAYINSVQDEDLQITSVSPYPYFPNVQFQLMYQGFIMDYVQINTANASLVNLISTGNVSYSLPSGTYALNSTNGIVSYNVIMAGTLVNNMTSKSILQIESSGTYAFQPATWQDLTIYVRNLNTANSEVSAISVNGRYLSNFSSNGVVYSTSLPLLIPAKGTVPVNLSVSTFDIHTTASLGLLLLSTVGNFFSGTFTPPNAIVSENTMTQNYQVASVDIPTFNGAQNNASSYLWEVLVPTSSWNMSQGWNSSNIQVAFVQGPTFQYRPNGLFNSLNGLDLAGPMEVMLIATSSNGLMSVSQPFALPYDPNIDPAGSFAVSCSATDCSSNSNLTITVTVSDLFAVNPLSGVPVIFIPENNGNSVITLRAYNGVTGSGAFPQGEVTVTTACTSSCSGTVEVIAGSLPPQFIEVTVS